MEPKTIQQYKDFWSDEQNSAYLYSLLAEIEKGEKISTVYQRFAEVELNHADKWEKLLKESGIQMRTYIPGGRTKLLGWLAKKLGPSAVLPTLQSMEQQGTRSYYQQEGGATAARDEKSHAFLLNQISGALHGGIEGSALAQLEGRHKTAGGNALRAAVLGANDGLVSNLSLVMGVAGADIGGSSVMIAGIAGLLAGAFSMALGEWLSVQSSRELFANQIQIEKLEIEQSPEGEEEELALIYESRGLKPDQAKTLANQILKNKESAVETMAREELGIDPSELGGSAWEAAITSFFLFSIGAVIPVMPFFFLHGYTAVLISIGLSVLGLFGLGAGITLFTGKKIFHSGMRMVIFGLLAAAITFGIGKLIGVSIGG
ncbi:MAG: VIT1/CCC1 transporter family protein [Anaerolineaceae bacterium]